MKRCLIKKKYIQLRYHAGRFLDMANVKPLCLLEFPELRQK